MFFTKKSLAKRDESAESPKNAQWAVLTAHGSWISSFRMTSFAAAQRMTTAEPPEPLDFQHSEFIIYNKSLYCLSAPAVRHFGVFCVFCG